MSDDEADTHVGAADIAKRGGVAVALSLVANAILLAAAQAVDVAPGFAALSWPPVLFLTTVGAIGATAAYWAIRRLSAEPDRRFTRVAIAVLLVSFLPDVGLLFGDPAATVPGVVVLMAMHATVAAICIAVLTGWAWR